MFHISVNICLHDYVYYNYQCYKLYNKKLPQKQAELYCEQDYDGGHLASIHSRKEMEFITEVLTRLVCFVFPLDPADVQYHGGGTARN